MQCVEIFDEMLVEVSSSKTLKLDHGYFKVI